MSSMDKTQQYYGGIEPLPILNALQEHEEELAISGFTGLSKGVSQCGVIVTRLQRLDESGL